MPYEYTASNDIMHSQTARIICNFWVQAQFLYVTGRYLCLTS